MKRAVIYTRISADPLNSQLGVQRQEADCRKLCKANKWEVVEVFEDNDVSASKNVKRPDYERMLALVEAGGASVIVAYAVDRLYRRISDLERLVEVASRLQLEIRTVSSGDIDLSTSDGRMSARILVSVAQKESERAGERIARKHEELAAAGKPAGQRRSFGYNEDLTGNMAEAKVIRDLVDRFFSGESIRSLTDSLNQRGIPSARGATGKWTVTTVRSLLASARISGQRERTRKSRHLRDARPAFGEIVGPAIWEPIITPQQTDSIRIILSDPSRRTRREGQYLLSGILRCSKCGNPMFARPEKDASGRRYACIKNPGTSRCGKTSIVGEKADAVVIAAIVEALNSTQISTAPLDVESDEIQDARIRRSEAESRLKSAASLWGAGELDDDEWRSLRDAAKKTIDNCNKALNQHKARHSKAAQMTGDQFSERLPQMPISAVRAIVRDVCEEVRVTPAKRGQNTFDATRISIRLR